MAMSRDEIFEKVQEVLVDALGLDDEYIGVRIPPRINKIKVESFDVAMLWRMHAREIFSTYLKRGYSLVDNITPAEADSPFFIYVLQWQGT